VQIRAGSKTYIAESAPESPDCKALTPSFQLQHRIIRGLRADDGCGRCGADEQ